jgi:hypothetical protein
MQNIFLRGESFDDIFGVAWPVTPRYYRHDIAYTLLSTFFVH